MFLGSEHEDGEDKERGEKHLYEYALRFRSSGAEGRADIERAGEDGGDYAGGAHAGDHLGDEAEGCAGRGQGADEVETQGNLCEVSMRGSSSISSDNGAGSHVLLTAGLNKPPLTRKNTHTLTIKLNPKTKLIYSSTLVFGACVMLFCSWPAVAASLYTAAVLATWVPPKAKKRNMKVPANSEAAATSSLRHLLVSQGTRERFWLVLPLVRPFV